MRYRDEAEQVLAAWRDVAGRLRDAPQNSAERNSLVNEWARLRLEYERLVDKATEENRVLPRRWPEEDEPNAKAG